MLCKLRTVVRCNGMDSIFVGKKHSYGCFCKALCLFAKLHLFHQQEPCFSFSYSQYGTFLVFSNHCVNFPVSITFLGINNSWAELNGNFIFDVQLFAGWTFAVPVSYTHLTLPTI